MNNPYYYRPQPSSVRAADDVFKHIAAHPQWHELFAQGKMLGVLVYSREPFKYICAYSGVVNGLDDPEHFFVPPIYDLQNPDDFYLQKDKEITSINAQLASMQLKQEVAKSKCIDKEVVRLKNRRKELSTALQLEIFSHFDFINTSGQYKNIVKIFSDSKRSLPPGGAGECAAPRLLQYAIQNGLQPLEIAECWYGRSSKGVFRVHGQFYPSCIEKCSPIINYMLQGINYARVLDAENPQPIDNLKVWYEDDYLIVIEKPAGVLSVPGKVDGDSVESYLHRLYPSISGAMLVHRLDQSTSGLMLAAKDATTHKILQRDFETRVIHKEYIACVSGDLKSRCGIINLPICPNPEDRPRQIVDFQFGKAAQTYYEVVSEPQSYFKDGMSVNKVNDKELSGTSTLTTDHTWLRLVPLTGRTHQLRLHLASRFGLGQPIVGDRIYNGEPAYRLMLHAYRLQFVHPITKEQLTIVTT